MGLGIVVLIVVIIAILLIKNIISLGLKIIGFGILAIVIGVTVWVCSTQPEMHKPFSLNTIEYLFKINKDGSMTTTKQTTQTVIKGVEK
jgi:hypothetical protein